MTTREDERVVLLAQVFAAGKQGGVTLGIGDDAAVLDSGVVCSVDVVVEHTHFRRSWLTSEELGFKATMAAASDLAAMGSVPCGVLASLVLPSDLDDAELLSLARGQAEACALLDTALIGGNLARGAALSITTTVLGRGGGDGALLRRDGARAGDGLWLAGQVGLAAAGLAALLDRDDGAHGGQPSADCAPLRVAVGEPGAVALRAWRRPLARIADGLDATAVGRGAIDVSDGLALDAARLAAASGVRVQLEASALLSEPLRAAALWAGRDPLELALHGGEDYALLVAAPVEATLPASFRRVGSCEAANTTESNQQDQQPRVWLKDGAECRPLAPRGFDHFARPLGE